MTVSGVFDISYDEVPYPELCYGFTHPGRLAAIGRLLNMEPAPPQDCRVLEIGCAGGGNLVPMAFSLPNSRFVGIDLSAGQIEAAGEFSRRLGLTNIHLQAMDLMDVTPEFGEFDYIIAHGMYSWVPRPVKDKLLSICQHNLSTTGIAYVSYNTFPGWHMLQMVRDMMLYHTRDITEPRERAQHARAVIKHVRSIIPDADDSVLGFFLDAYIDTRLANFAGHAAWQDSALLHDELGAVNEPVYFHQFIEHAEQHRLQYLTEATFPQANHDLPPETIARLRDMTRDNIEFEQHLDYVRQQSFRRTLLCHEAAHICRAPRAEDLADLYLTSRSQLVDGDEGNAHFRSNDGSIYTAEHPVTTAALNYLSEVSPRAVHLPALIDEALKRVGTPQPDRAVAERLPMDLLEAATRSNQQAELLAYDPTLAALPSEYPLASPVVRLQAPQSPIVSNLRHEQITLAGLSRALVPLLNGRRTRDDLLAELLTMIDEGRLTSSQQQAIPPDQIEQQMANDIEHTLRWLGRAAILLS